MSKTKDWLSLLGAIIRYPDRAIRFVLALLCSFISDLLDWMSGNDEQGGPPE